MPPCFIFWVDHGVPARVAVLGHPSTSPRALLLSDFRLMKLLRVVSG